MLITQCNDESTAIEFLSVADFDVQTAIALYNTSREDSPNVGRSGQQGTTASKKSEPPKTQASSNGSPYTNTGVGSRFTSSSAPPAANSSPNNGFTYGDYDYDDDVEGGDNPYVAPHDTAVDASAYNPQARRLMDNGAPQLQLNKELAYVDDTQDYDSSFISKHFGEIAIFRLPKWGCESRYLYHGDDPSLLGEYGQEANPILSHFKYCCAVAEKQRKFVFLLILRGEKTFSDSCCVRDLLSRRSSAASFLQEHFLSFFQVVLPGALDHVRNTPLGKLQTNQPDVARMIHFSSFLSTYQIGTSASENLLPGGRLPPNVTTDEQRRVYNVFCNNPFPVIAVINPQTQSLVKRIPLARLYRVRNSAAELDADTFMEELTQALDSNLIDENFFLRRESTAGDDSPQGSPNKDSTPAAYTSATTAQAPSASTVPRAAAHSSAKQSYNVDDDDDNNYEYDYSSPDMSREVSAVPPSTEPISKAPTQPLAAPTSMNLAEVSTSRLSPPPATPPRTATPPPAATAPAPSASTTGAAPANEQQANAEGVVELDVSKFIGPSAIPSAECFKLRVQTPKGQFAIEFAKTMPLRFFCAYLTALCTTSKMVTSGGVSSPTPTGGNAPPPTRFIMDDELRCIIGGTKFLGGFPPKPLEIPQDTVVDAIVAADGHIVSSQEAATQFLSSGPNLADWGKVRTNDSIRPSLP